MIYEGVRGDLSQKRDAKMQTDSTYSTALLSQNASKNAQRRIPDVIFPVVKNIYSFASSCYAGRRTVS